MKLERIAQVAMIALLATACTGDDPQASPPTPAESTVERVSATTTVAPSTTAAPTTTTAAPAPTSLAFASTKDIGRLFLIDGQQNVFINAGGGEVAGIAEANSLVQATSARSRDGVLWVRVQRVDGDYADLGWVQSDALLPTSRSVIDDDPFQSGELRVTRRSGQAVPVVRDPGGSEQVATLESQEVAMHGGSIALSASGERWLDVIDPNSRSRVGWVLEDAFGRLRSNLVQDRDHLAIRTRPDNTITYGASLTSLRVSLIGCNAVQVSFTNPSASEGLAVVLGESVPTGEVRNGKEVWGSRNGGRIYADPGADVTLTLLSNSPQTWYFASLDQDFRAEASRQADGSLVEQFGSLPQATNVQTVSLESGSCVYIPKVVDPDDGPTTYGEDVGLTGPADDAAREAAAAEAADDSGAGSSADETTTTTVAEQIPIDDSVDDIYDS